MLIERFQIAKRLLEISKKRFNVSLLVSHPKLATSQLIDDSITNKVLLYVIIKILGRKNLSEFMAGEKLSLTKKKKKHRSRRKNW